MHGLSPLNPSKNLHLFYEYTTKKVAKLINFNEYSNFQPGQNCAVYDNVQFILTPDKV
jgi:hypothetical protein